MMQLSSEEVARLFNAAPAGTLVYLVGAGGCGMSGLGHLLLDAGFRVAGSDLTSNREIRELRERGARIDEGHSACRLEAERPGLVVYSSAIPLDNPELQEAERLRIPIIRRGVLLAVMLRGRCGICVAGMHGKTTTTGLLAFALERLASGTGYAVGALVPQFRHHARWQPAQGMGSGKEQFFVVEADESDGTLTEFRPVHSIVLNVDEDHLDYYQDLEAVCREFRTFGNQTRETLIFCADDARLPELFTRQAGAISYGFHSLAGYRLVLLPEQGTGVQRSSVFEVWHRGQKFGEFCVQLIGEKNVSNAGAVVALLHELGYGAEEIGTAIGGFKGAARRQEVLFADERFRVIDDYGHHPVEIEATIRALRGAGARRLLVAFQPHRFTRTRALLEAFGGCFREADELWVTEVYGAGESAVAGTDGARLTEGIRAGGQMAQFIPDLTDLRRSVRAAMMPGDWVMFLGAGDITRVAHELADELCEEPVTGKEEFLAELTESLSRESLVKIDEPLAKRTTLRVGGTADVYVEPSSEEDLSRVLRLCGDKGMRFTLLGRGSNLLIRDGGIRGVVISLGHESLSQVTVADALIHCGAGARLKAVSMAARRAGLTGLEFLEGIPGSLGGAMRMNAGAMGSWLFDVIERIRFMDYSGRVHERMASEVNVEYRGCPLFKDHIALGAVLKGQPASQEAVNARMQQFSAKRWESQPAASSAGCIFKNPATIPAGKLIDELGLKGTRVGGAVVSDVHGNFIVNDGRATARDVLELIEVIKDRARSIRGIDLETEVEILGEE